LAGEQYIICLSNWSFVNATVVLDFFGTAGIQCSLVLPVEMLDLTAQRAVNGSVVKWITGTEQNCDYFDVEHSADGINWQVFGTVNGAGNSSQTRHYQFPHIQPTLGWNYYRLRQVDINGMFRYYGPVSLLYEDQQPLVFPNPASDVLHISGIRANKANIHNALGQLVDTAVSQDESGIEALDISHLYPGVYHVQLFEGNQSWIYRILIE
jgi:Secretion system C-terminal sorting domain